MSDESIWRTRVLSTSMPEYVGELVRCKNCVWGKAVEQIGCLRFEDREDESGLKDPDGFCAWAEKRED